MDAITTKLISWNVNGVSKKSRTSQNVFLHLKSLAYNIAIAQEKHMSEGESLKLNQRCVGQVFSTPGNSIPRSVSIFIFKHFSFKPVNVCADKECRYTLWSSSK